MAAQRPMNTTTTRLRSRAASLATACALVTTILAVGPTTPPAVAVSGSEAIVTAAGGGADGHNEGGAATSAELSFSSGLAVGGSGDLYIVNDAFVRRVDASGVITTVAGNGGYEFSGDGGPATAAQTNPHDVTVHADGSLYISGNARIRRVVPGADGVVNGGADETITTVAGNGSFEFSGDGGPATAAGGVEGTGLITDGAGNLFSSAGNRVRKVVPGPDGVVNGGAGETITTLAGTGAQGSSGDGGRATDATLWQPHGLVADDAGNLFIADLSNARVRRVDAGGTINTVAGTGARGFSGDGGRAVEAMLNSPRDVALDAAGNLYIADTLNARVRKVDAAGVITTVAGTGIRGYSGDGGPATEAQLSYPNAIVVDPVGALYVNDAGFPLRVRRVGPNLLGLAMADSADPVATGGELTYTLTVRNYASSPASATRLRDTLPPGTSFRSATPSQGACAEAGGTVTCELGTLAPRATATVSIVVAAPSAPTPAGQPMENRATVSAGEADPFPQDNLATSRTTVIVPADLSVQVADSPDPVGVGQPLTYTFTVANAGPGPATQVKLVNPLPESVTILQMGASSPGGCSEYRINSPSGGFNTRGGVQCSWPSLAPGATGTGWVQIAAPSESDTTGVESTVFTNTATVSAAEPDADTTNNADSEDTVVATTARPAGLGVAVEDSPDPVQEGQRLVYTLTVGNALPLEATATAVSLTDTLASAFTFRSATPSQGVCSPPPPSPTGPSGGTVSCALGAMGPGATATVAIEVSADADGDHPNVATVSALEAPDPSTAMAITRVSDRDCGQRVERDYTLVADIGPCAGNGLVVAADDLTVDLGGHHLFGFPGPSDGKQAGVRVEGRSGVTVTNRHPDRPGIVSGFDAGVLLQGGGGHSVADIVATANVGPETLRSPDLGDGIAVIRSANNNIVGNTLVGNGQYDNIAVLGHQADGNTIEANTLETTVSTGEGIARGPLFNMQGIFVNARLDDSDKGLAISNTTIKNNTVRGHDGPGISSINSVDGAIVANFIEGNGRGIGVAVGNEFSGPTRMLIADNTLVDNKFGVGIELLLGARDNLVTNNRVVHKNVTPVILAASSDLRDHNPKCGSNSWVANTSGLGTYSPECVRTPPPDTSFVSGPSGPTDDDTPTFDFASSIEGSDFFCRVDGANFAPCASPYTTLALGLGAHSFEVKARGPVGNSDPTPAMRSFVVEPPARLPVADFDGNGASDISVFRAGSGSWFPQGGTDAYWGTEGDLAVPANYDGLAGTEMAVFRPSSGTWFVKGGQTTAWGTAGDLAVPGDYDGDKKADIVVFRPSSGVWYIRPSGGGAEQSVAWGTTGDIPVPGDYNGDGTTEIAVFRPSSGTWYVQGGPTLSWGTEGDIPVPGDYDASGDTDMAVFRPSSGTWFVEGGATLGWGTTGDIPVPGDFDGNASADIAVFRPSSGTWFVNGGATTNWGTAGDQPLPLPPAIRQSLAT